jgi:hypothetical protein
VDFALVDGRLLVVVIKFDRVFDRDDVVVGPLVDVVDQRSERGAFSRTGRTGDKNQTARPHTQPSKDLRNAEEFRRHHLVGDLPQHHRDVAALLKNRNPETGFVGKSKPEVGTARLLQFALATLGGDTFHQADRVFGLEDLGFQATKPTVQPKNGGLANGDVNVARALLDTGLEQFVD